MAVTFDVLSLLHHHTQAEPDPTPEQFEELVLAAEGKTGEQIDRQEVQQLLATLKGLVAEGERWHKVAHLLTSPDPPRLDA